MRAPRTPEYIRKHNLKQRYGITTEQYDALLEKQGGGCGICGSLVPGSGWTYFAVDHDHQCCPDKAKSCGKCLRGLLCSSCNYGLGKFYDDDQSLRAAANYVAKYKRKRIRECLKSKVSIPQSETLGGPISVSPSNSRTVK